MRAAQPVRPPCRKAGTRNIHVPMAFLFAQTARVAGAHGRFGDMSKYARWPNHALEPTPVGAFVSRQVGIDIIGRRGPAWSLGHFTRTIHMNTENTFNAIFWTLFASMFLMRFWFGFRVWRTGERLLPDRAALHREGFWTVTFDRLFSLLVAVVVLLWFQGNSLRSLAFPAPDWLRWSGVALGIASVGLFAWSHAVLGRFWSPTLQIRSDNQLITAGPYARIRHPSSSAILA